MSVRRLKEKAVILGMVLQGLEATPRVIGSSSAPSYGATFQMAVDVWNPAEDLLTQQFEAQDSVAKKSIYTGSSLVGSYTELVRGDLEMIFLYYPLNGTHWCGAYSYPSFAANPFSFAGMPSVGSTLVHGIRAEHFRVSVAAGSYITGAYTRAEGGAPLMLTLPSQQQNWDFTFFDNTTTPPSRLFDVPEYCT